MRESFFAIGSRKSATAKVWLMPQGKGEIKINNRDGRTYLTRDDLYEYVLMPFKVTGTIGQFDVICSCRGGGLSAQTGAIVLGIARALVAYDPEMRKTLKSAELLKRDPREKERCKYGLAKRRKSFQWTKR